MQGFQRPTPRECRSRVPRHRPHHEDADVLERSVLLVLENRIDEARAVLPTLPTDECFPLPKIDATAPPFNQLDRPIKRPLEDHQRFAIYERDGWRCRYCGRKMPVDARRRQPYGELERIMLTLEAGSGSLSKCDSKSARSVSARYASNSARR